MYKKYTLQHYLSVDYRHRWSLQGWLAQRLDFTNLLHVRIFTKFVFLNILFQLDLIGFTCRVCARQCAEFALDNFLFLDPYRCSETMVKSDLSAAATYLANVMKAVQNPDSYILLPYISRLEYFLTNKYFIYFSEFI